MNLPKLAIERPVFISCVVILLMVLGSLAYRSLGVDLFPDVSFPFVSVITPYQGAAPQEIESQISKPMEEQFSTLQGLKKVYSVNQEGYSVVTLAFTLETDSKDAEQRVRDRLAFVRPRLPKGIDEPVVQRMDPSDQPVVTLSMQSTLDAYHAYDLADQIIKPLLSQVEGVGVVDIFGGSKREIRVELDRAKLNAYRISASLVANNIGLNGLNVPVGKYEINGKNVLFRSVGEYNDLERLQHTVVNFLGSDVPITVDKVGRVVDTVEDAKNYSSFNGKPALFFLVHKQSKANTVAVVDGVKAALDHLNETLKGRPGSPVVDLVQDDAKFVRLNLDDVRHTILIGICLTILVVFFFLGSFRSTLITITALPVSLLGAFILMNGMGFTLNLMTLLALSLAVGLLIDDAIVVRENIWRHIENGEEPKKAALTGTMEVALAVVATSSVVIAVFLPIAFLKGTVGQFFRQFGMTVCFAMAVSLFEAMVMGPMLSAYWAKKAGKGWSPIDALDRLFAPVLKGFDRFQTWLEKRYEAIITWCLHFEVERLFSDLKNQFNGPRKVFAWVWAIHPTRLVEEVKQEQKNGYSFAPLLYFLLELFGFGLGVAHQWEVLSGLGVLVLGLWVLGARRDPSPGSQWFDFNGWVFILFSILVGSNFFPVLLKAAYFFLLVECAVYFIRNRHFIFAHQFYDHRWWVLEAAFFIFVGSLFAGPKFTFLPNGDNGEFMVSLKMAPGTSLDSMREKALKVSGIIRTHPEIELTSEVVGDTQGNDNQATLYAKLTHWKKRKLTTSDMKDIVRKDLEPFRAELSPQVGDRDLVGNMAPFNMVLAGDDYKTLEPLAQEILEKFKTIEGLTDVQTNFDGGKAEFQVRLDPDRCRQLGVLGTEVGNELRTQVEGAVPAKFRENGLEYDIRVRMLDEQRDLQKAFNGVWVPNSNHNQVRLSDIAQPVTTEGPAKINRLNRQRYIMVSGQLGKGAALGSIQTGAEKILGSLKLPPDVSYSFIGQAEDMKDLMTSMVMAIGLAFLFTYMILASLYESPVLPFTIMMSIPLAVVGALVALKVTDQSLNIFSMISVVMLMGLVTKNAILLVDYTVQMERKGMRRDDAIRQAGIVRLRPILMTTLALIAGMLPTALALTEVAKFRQSMGVAVIGGLLSSLFLTLVVVPSVYGYVDDFRLWLRRVFGMDPALSKSAQSKASRGRGKLVE